MMTMILMLIAFAAGMVLREYFARPVEVLSPEARELSAAMRDTDNAVAYESGVYTVYTDGARIIRYLSGVRVSLLMDCGYTLAFCGNNATF